MTRRIVRTVLGAVSGLIGGLGATIVLTQSGRITFDSIATPGVTAIVVGAAVGFVEPPRWVLRLIGLAILAASAGVVVIAIESPAAAQESCELRAIVDGATYRLDETSRGRPLAIDVGAEPEIELVATAPAAEGEVVVTVAGIHPSPAGLIEPDETELFSAGFRGGAAVDAVRVERAGRTGFLVVGERFRTPFVPLGLVELRVDVRDPDGRPIASDCPETVWVRAVATPIDNDWGRAGLGASAFGLLGLLIVGPLRRPFGLGPRRTPPRSGQQRPGDEAPGGPPPRLLIDARPPSVDHTEVQILGADGSPLDPTAPLAVGREYRIQVTFGAGLHERADDRAGAADGDRPQLAVGATSPTLEIGASIAVTAPGLPIAIPIVPTRLGRHRVLVHASHRGHHVQTEEVSLPVVDSATPTTGIGGPIRSTLINTAVPSDEVLRALPARQVLITLLADDDHTVDARITDVDGNEVVHYDSPLPAQALDTAARHLRGRLGDALAASAGRLSLGIDELADRFGPVVAAGQTMSMTMFADTAVTDGDVDALRGLVGDGATIQVVTDGSGLGHTSLPWALVYDRPFVARAAGNPICPSFATHAIDRCPHESEPQTWCPTGFWGHRAVIEELWTPADRQLLAPPVGPAGTGSDEPVIVAYLDDELVATPTQVRALDRRGATRLVDFDDVCRWMSEDDADVDLLYLYAHHRAGIDGGLVVGRDVLSPGTVNALRNRAPDRWRDRPLVIVNACASGAHESTDPVSFVAELRAYGAGGVVATECPLWDPVAGECGLRILEGLDQGREIGAILRDLRRGLLAADHNPIGLAYRLQASARASTRRAPA